MSDAKPQELTERFVDAVEYLNRQTHLVKLDEWDGSEMTIPQIKTLGLLHRMGPLRMGSIAVCLGRALSATTTVVDRLVEKNLVARGSDPRDRRVVVCELTAAGRAAVDRFWRVDRERVLSVTEFLTPEELEIAVRGMELIRHADEGLQKALATGESPE